MIGIVYGARDRVYHLAEWEPYVSGPALEPLCRPKSWAGPLTVTGKTEVTCAACLAEKARRCQPTSPRAAGTPRVPAHERPTCCPWYSEHEWCATARPAPAAGPTGTRTGSEGR